MPMKLGKREPKEDAKRLRFGKYVAELPVPPMPVDWRGARFNTRAMLNDQLSDCTCAGIGHSVQSTSACLGPLDSPTDDEILRLYEDTCGYVPGNPATDQGGFEIDVLNWIRKNTFGGRKLFAYADTDLQNTDHVKQAVYYFGGVYIGLSLPDSVIDVPNMLTVPWVVGGNPNSSNGHAVWVPYCDDNGLICDTWGIEKEMTWDFFTKYCDESHAILWQIWLDNAPNAFKLGDLQSDLAALDD